MRIIENQNWKKLQVTSVILVYVLNKEVFELARTSAGELREAEFELTDAINAYIDGGGVIAVGEAKGEYMKCDRRVWLAEGE